MKFSFLIIVYLIVIVVVMYLFLYYFNGKQNYDIYNFLQVKTPGQYILFSQGLGMSILNPTDIFENNPLTLSAMPSKFTIKQIDNAPNGHINILYTDDIRYGIAVSKKKEDNGSLILSSQYDAWNINVVKQILRVDSSGITSAGIFTFGFPMVKLFLSTSDISIFSLSS